jgi:hypothetical protein
MLAAVILFATPILLFVLAFLFETFLSFRRLTYPKVGRAGYLSATWEVTHTLLIFGVVMLVMLFTSSLNELSSAIFTSTFIAAAALTVRSATYTYIFYVRTSKKTSWIDWTFALSHVVAALFLVVTVLKACWYLYKNNPPVNSQFIPAFIPGLVLVLAICIVPIITLYRTRD